MIFFIIKLHASFCQIKFFNLLLRDFIFTIYKCISNSTYQYFLHSNLLPLIGLEPILSCEKGILSPSCLPIPPQWHNFINFVLSLRIMDYIIYFVALVFIIFVAMYINRQIQVSRNIRLEDTTLEKLDEKLKRHKLIGGRHKRTNKKNPPIV